MPDVIPKSVLIRRVVDKLAKGIRYMIRGILVATIWLIFVPYFTIWVWRMYFWMGDKFAHTVNGLETPVWNTAASSKGRHVTYLQSNATTVGSTDRTSVPQFSMELFLKNNLGLAHDHWISHFLVDCFEGQIISCLSVLIFLILFSLREWVTRHRRADRARVPQGRAPAVAQENAGERQEGAAFEIVEHAVERLIAAQHQLEAVVEGEDDSDGSEESDRSSGSDASSENHQSDDEDHSGIEQQYGRAPVIGVNRLDDAQPRQGAPFVDHDGDMEARHRAATERLQQAREQHRQNMARHEEMNHEINGEGMQQARAEQDPREPVALEALLLADAGPEPEANREEENEDGNLGGILRAIGMQGSYWMLLQSSLLLAAWISVGLGVGIWLPFMIGKTVLLIRPFNALLLSYKLLDGVMNLIVDFVLDHLMPLATPILTKASLPLTGVDNWAALQSFFKFTQSDFFSSWQKVFGFEGSGLGSSSLTKDGLASMTESIAPEAVAGSAAAVNSTSTPLQVVQTWSEWSLGNSHNNVLAIIAGYSIMLVAASWYLSKIRHSYLIASHRAARKALQETLSVLKSTCRQIVRPGVMWFLRDPNDPDYHPVREVLERPFWVQLRRMGIEVLMFISLIIVGMVVPALVLRPIIYITASNWSISSTARKLLERWWHVLSRWMRLSSFMFARNGERFLDEEGHVEYRTWGSWLRRERPPILGVETTAEETVGSGEELDIDAPVIFVRDGGFYRVPSSARIRHNKNWHIFVPVDESGLALDPNDDMPCESDQFSALPGNATPSPVDPRENTIVVYGPPHFQLRLVVFVLLFWVSVTHFAWLAIIVPHYVGRNALALVFDLHIDSLALHVGLVLFYAVWWISDRVVTNAHLYSRENLQSIDVKAQMNALFAGAKKAASALAFGVNFGVILPVQVGLIFELYIVRPPRVYIFQGADHVNFGPILGLGIEAFDNLMFIPPLEWNLREVLIPGYARTTSLILVPRIIAELVIFMFEDVPEDIVELWSHSLCLLMLYLVLSIRKGVNAVRGWSAYVRDQEYLLGQQLHNLVDHEVQTTPATNEVKEPSVIETVSDKGEELHSAIEDVQQQNLGHTELASLSSSSFVDNSAALSSSSSSSASASTLTTSVFNRVKASLASTLVASDARVIEKEKKEEREEIGNNQDDEHPQEYGIRGWSVSLSDSESEKETNNRFKRRDTMSAQENNDDDDDAWENGSIASRIRSRRNLRFRQNARA
ncbi:E3 ubiquitin-protein ligase march7 [Podila epigama]|nr:E3 ubiquitin-protein ligase march7 [Podila epigama]